MDRERKVYCLFGSFSCFSLRLLLCGGSLFSQCSSAWEVKIPQPRDQKLDTQEANADVASGFKVYRNNVLLPLSAESVGSTGCTQAIEVFPNSL